MKLTDQVAWHEIAGHKIAGHEFPGHKNARHELAGHENAGTKEFIENAVFRCYFVDTRHYDALCVNSSR